jgi:hypothetical protein
MSIYSEYKPRKTRNFLDNANFCIQQRGAGQFFNSGITADRWGFYYDLSSGGSAAVTLHYNIDLPVQSANSIFKVTALSQKTSYPASEYVVVQQSIEGYNFLGLKRKMATLSFWVKATVPGTYSIAFRNSTYSASYVKEYTINASDTWEYKRINIDFDYGSVGDGGWHQTNGPGVHFCFVLACSSSRQTSTIGQWISGNYIASTNQAVYSQSINNSFILSQVQLEQGIEATPFELLDIFTEYNRALRYYEYKYIICPASCVTNGTCVTYFNIEFAEKRVKPISITVDNPRVYLSWGVAWRNATSILYNSNAAYMGRALMLFYDTANSDYTAGWTNLIDGGFSIKSDL